MLCRGVAAGTTFPTWLVYGCEWMDDRKVGRTINVEKVTFTLPLAALKVTGWPFPC